MASFIHSQKAIETYHYPESHTTTKRVNTDKNEKINLILQGNGVEACKIGKYSLNILNNQLRLLSTPLIFMCDLY